MKNKYVYKLLLTAILTIALHTEAKVKVAGVFSNHMVLQQQKPVDIWGTADAMEKIKVAFGKQRIVTAADAEGRWKATLRPMQASAKPQVMTISGNKNKIRISDVLVGEVWLCSGQSNMEYSMNNHPQYKKPQKGDRDYQIKAWKQAGNPNIRLLYVKKSLKSDTLPTDGWKQLCPESLKPVSAAGYFFAKMLQDSLQVPVGIISSSWGGTKIEEWTPGVKPSGLRPLWKKLIAPAAGYALRGFLWYQGESNLIDGDTDTYAQKQEKLFNAWRSAWGDASLPFYYVQISPLAYSQRKGDIIPKTWLDLPHFWTAQTEGMKQKNTGMVVTTDIPDDMREIHPPYKWIIGERLCRWALNRTYGYKHVECCGPQLKEAVRKGNKIILSFEHADGGLTTNNGKAPDWFYANTQNNGRFRKLNAQIEGSTVILDVPESIKHPVIRFGYDEVAQPNLRNKAGLPAIPFEIKL